jgi:hypothetical protein
MSLIVYICFGCVRINHQNGVDWNWNGQEIAILDWFLIVPCVSVLCYCVLVLVVSSLLKLARCSEFIECLAETLSPSLKIYRAQAWSLESLERAKRDLVLRDTSTETYVLWNQTLVNQIVVSLVCILFRLRFILSSPL